MKLFFRKNTVKVIPGRSWPQYTIQFHFTSPNNFSHFRVSYSLLQQNNQNPTSQLIIIIIIKQYDKNSKLFLFSPKKCVLLSIESMLSFSHSLSYKHIHSTHIHTHTHAYNSHTHTVHTCCQRCSTIVSKTVLQLKSYFWRFSVAMW